MRKFVIAVLALGLLLAPAAFAGGLVNEAFTYGAGNLVPNNPGAPALGPWALYSGATGDIQVGTGYAAGIMATTAFANDDGLPFTLQTLTNSTYYCVDVFIPCFGTTAPLPSYFAGLKDSGSTLLVARLYVLALGTSGSFTLGVSQSSTSTTVGVTPWGSALSCDTWYHVVVKYDPVAKTTTLWVNPVNEASTNVVDTNATSTSVAVSSFFLRQGGASTLPPAPSYAGATVWNWRVDNLGVGLAWDTACYLEPVPVSKGTWGQLKSLYR